jgi:hypothetical protein
MSNLIPETQTHLQSINRFLEDVYGHPRWLSDKRFGFRIWDWESPKSLCLATGQAAIRNRKSEIGNGISRQRVHQLETSALGRLRLPSRRRRLEHMALEVAEEILGTRGRS